MSNFHENGGRLHGRRLSSFLTWELIAFHGMMWVCSIPVGWNNIHDTKFYPKNKSVAGLQRLQGPTSIKAAANIQHQGRIDQEKSREIYLFSLSNKKTVRSFNLICTKPWRCCGKLKHRSILTVLFSTNSRECRRSEMDFLNCVNRPFSICEPFSTCITFVGEARRSWKRFCIQRMCLWCGVRRVEAKAAEDVWVAAGTGRDGLKVSIALIAPQSHTSSLSLASGDLSFWDTQSNEKRRRRRHRTRWMERAGGRALLILCGWVREKSITLVIGDFSAKKWGKTFFGVLRSW